MENPRAERQEKMKGKFIECACEACRNDYPLNEDCLTKGLITEKTRDLFWKLFNVFDYNKKNKKVLVRGIPKVFEVLAVSDHLYPSREHYYLHTCVFQYIKLIHMETPLEIMLAEKGAN